MGRGALRLHPGRLDVAPSPSRRASSSRAQRLAPAPLPGVLLCTASPVCYFRQAPWFASALSSSLTLSDTPVLPADASATSQTAGFRCLRHIAKPRHHAATSVPRHVWCPVVVRRGDRLGAAPCASHLLLSLPSSAGRDPCANSSSAGTSHSRIGSVSMRSVSYPPRRPSHAPDTSDAGRHELPWSGTAAHTAPIPSFSSLRLMFLLLCVPGRVASAQCGPCALSPGQRQPNARPMPHRARCPLPPQQYHSIV